jgi:tetratricopeptide (TPR) repeat protein
MKGFKLEYKDSLSARKYFEQATHKFLSAYQADTINIEIVKLLPDAYYKIQKFDSALLWAIKLLPSDSLRTLDVPTSFAGILREIGFYYLNLADIETGKQFLQRSLRLDSTQHYNFLGRLEELSDQIFYRKYPKQIEEFELKQIDPCQYSLSILTLGNEIGKDDQFVETYLPGKIQQKKKNCR